jgi:predicted O-methyltransferase YrrM
MLTKPIVTYAKRALEFSKPGTLIVFDNVVRSGTVLTDQEPWFQGIRDTFEWLKTEERLEATAVQTVGPKGWDGFAMARVVD